MKAKTNRDVRCREAGGHNRVAMTEPFSLDALVRGWIERHDEKGRRYVRSVQCDAEKEKEARIRLYARQVEDQGWIGFVPMERSVSRRGGEVNGE